MHRSCVLNLAMSLKKWLVPRNDDCSGSDKRALMVTTKAVKAVQKECKELEHKGRKRKLRKRHHYKYCSGVANTFSGLRNI